MSSRKDFQFTRGNGLLFKKSSIGRTRAPKKKTQVAPVDKLNEELGEMFDNVHTDCEVGVNYYDSSQRAFLTYTKTGGGNIGMALSVDLEHFLILTKASGYAYSKFGQDKDNMKQAIEFLQTCLAHMEEEERRNAEQQLG